MSDLPKAMGYRMPAEWEPHEGTWLSWPHNPRTWVGNFGPIPSVFVKIVGALCPSENVHICVRDTMSESSVRKLLKDAGLDSNSIHFYHIPTNDAWARDHGPVFITRNRHIRSGAQDMRGDSALLFGLESVELSALEIPQAVLNLVPATLCRKYGVMPFDFFDSVLMLATSEGEAPPVLDEIRALLKYQIEPVLAKKEEISAAIEKYHGSTALEKDGQEMAVLDREHDVPKSKVAVVDWKFNSWGGKYPPWEDDDAVPERVAETLRLTCFHPRMVLEGGSIDVNGKGTLLTTESVMLNPNRNPLLSKKQIESRLDEYLAAKNVIWLGDGILGDDTDGHVDDLTRFVNASTLVTVFEDDATDENFRALNENHERLQTAKDQDGHTFEIIKLPTPGKVFRGARHGERQPEERLPASYANFYIGNGCLLAPVFGHKNDAKVLGLFGDLFPGRVIIGINCKDLVGGYGAIHCVTQQQPA